jgi:sterol desaturase/sphingolipid hydroxylase (fatty acid hydroxylase superfamily)
MDGFFYFIYKRNNHVDHHKFHGKNFGIYNIGLDLLFGTSSVTGFIELGNFKIEKIDENDFIILNFEKNVDLK